MAGFLASQASDLARLTGGELNTHDLEQEDLWVSITTILDTIRSKLSESVLSILRSVLKVSDGIIPTVSAVVSAIVTLLSSIITLAIQYNSTAVKLALGASILAALTSFVSNITLLFTRFGFWDSSAAHNAAVELTSNIASTITEQPSVVANSLDFRTWLTVGVTSLVAILFAGIGLSGAVSWRDLITGSNVLESVKKSSNNIQSVADFILKDMAGLQMDKDYPQCLQLEALAEAGAALQQLSVADFVQKPDKLYELRAYVKKLISATSVKFSTDNSRRYATIRQLLIEIYRQLTQKLDAINAILATKPRQVTIALMLSGPPGHGKSEFGKYITKRVAQALNYPTNLYCLNKKSDGFYEPYGGSAIGVFNEFMAMRSEDAILKDLNLILSSDPMNFEAACLEGKSQPCQLKLVFLTSNSHNPEIIRVLSEGAVRATWDRIYHIAVDDPLCLGRHHPNPHRKPDFSHLNFRLVSHPSPDNITMTPVTLKDIEERLIGRCANAERDYIREILNTEPSSEVATSLMDRHRLLGEIMIQCKPYDSIVTPNNLGREFFVTRFQGLPGSGKSTLVEQLARECSNLFSFPLEFSRNEAEFQPRPLPAIYVLDDWVEPNNVQSFVQKMNQTHEKSMFFVTSNTQYQRVSFYCDPLGCTKRFIGSLAGLNTACPWDASRSGFPDGALRRIGLQGFIKIPTGKIIQTPELYQRTFNFCENFVVRDAYDRIGTREEIMDLIFKSYRTYLSTPSEYTLVHGLPPAMKDPGVTLEAPNALELIDGLRSDIRRMNAYIGREAGFRLLVADRLKGPTASSQTMMSTWAVVEQPSDDPAVLESIWSRMCATFNRTFPGEALLLRLTESQTTYYYEGGISYYYGPETLTRTIPVDVDGDAIIYYRDQFTPIRVTAEEFVAARIYNQFTGSLTTCTAAEYRAINRAFVSYMSMNPNSSIVTHYKVEQLKSNTKYSTRALWLKATFKKNPIFWIGASLLSLVCVGGAMYSFIRLCQTVHAYFGSQNTIPNTSPPVETRGHNPARAVLARIKTKPNSDPPEKYKVPHSQVALRRMRTRANEFDSLSPCDGWEWPPSSHRAESVFAELRAMEKDGEHATHALHQLLKRNPDWIDIVNEHPLLGTVYANMLRLEDMIKSPPSEIETFHSSVKRSYVHIAGPEGVCYGIHLRDGYILTVSHLFDELGQSATITHNSTSYAAVVTLIDRDRDLSVIRVIDKQFPGLPNTRRFFMPRSELEDPKYGFFLRCGPECQAMGGLITYYRSASPPITSSANQKYQLSSKLMVHIATALNKTRSFIKMGDCGFPMVCESSSGLRIAGIHNGYNQSEKSYYSSFTTHDFDDFIDRASITPNIFIKTEELAEYTVMQGELDGLLPVYYANAIESIEPDLSYGHYSDRLHILGFSPVLNLRSRPKGSHRPLQGIDYVTECETLPAAFTMEHVVDSSTLATNTIGVPSPLFTQCLKYDANPQPSFDSYIFEESVGLVMQDVVSRYGGCRFLRLHETLNGIIGGNLPPIETRTSGGPLLKLLHNVTTKAPLFDVQMNGGKGKPVLTFRKEYPPSLMVREHYCQYMDSLLNNYMSPILVSKDCAKVELIDASKAASGKVRLFNEIDLSINLVLRSIFGDFAGKVMAQHLVAPIRMGQDPYISATAISRQFNEIHGNVVSTDFSSFDKQLPLELIYAFCMIVSRCMSKTGRSQEELDRIFSALSRSLTYVFHTCRGVIYLVDRGNESGSFVTTLLNSISVDILTTYTLTRKWMYIFKFVPSLSELSRHSRKAILGDDRSLKVSSELCVTQDDLIEDSKLFCLKCTPAKTESGIDFCSRAIIWDPKLNMAYPALKVSSVTSQLHWTTNFSEKQLIDNCDNALFEAALHSDASLFNACLTDALSILRAYQIPLESLSFHSRDLIRTRFASYVRGGGSYAIPMDSQPMFHEDPVTFVYRTRRAHDVLRHKTYIQLLEERGDYHGLSIYFQTNSFLELYVKFHSRFPYSYIIDNPKQFLYQFCQHFSIKSRPYISFDEGDGGFFCLFEFMGYQIREFARTKAGAESLCFRIYINRYLPQYTRGDSRVQENCKRYLPDITGPIKQFTEFVKEPVDFTPYTTTAINLDLQKVRFEINRRCNRSVEGPFWGFSQGGFTSPVSADYSDESSYSEEEGSSILEESISGGDTE